MATLAIGACRFLILPVAIKTRIVRLGRCLESARGWLKGTGDARYFIQRIARRVTKRTVVVVRLLIRRDPLLKRSADK